MNDQRDVTEELDAIASMPFASKDWFLRLRMPDGTIVPVPLVPEQEFVTLDSQKRQTIRYVADISGYAGFQREFQKWSNAIRRYLMIDGGDAFECPTELHVAVVRKRRYAEPREWLAWEAVLMLPHRSQWDAPTLAYTEDGTDADNPEGVLSRLGIIDGESLARMMHFCGYDWSPEMQSWPHTADSRPW